MGSFTHCVRDPDNRNACQLLAGLPLVGGLTDNLYISCGFQRETLIPIKSGTAATCTQAMCEPLALILSEISSETVLKHEL